METEKAPAEVSIDGIIFLRVLLDFNLAVLALTFAFSLDLKSIRPMKSYPFGVDFRNVFMVF